VLVPEHVDQLDPVGRQQLDGPLGVVADLGVADALAGGARPVAEIAEKTDADPDTLQRIMRALASDGVFVGTNPHPRGYGTFAKILGEYVRDEGVLSLEEAVRKMTASTAGIFGEAGHADYAAAKSAILGGLLLSLKNEIVRIAPLGRVNAVAPGWTESPMTRGFVDEDRVRTVTRTMALRKVAQPEDVAAQIVALASDEISGHVSGQVIVVAGGMEGRTVHPE